MDTRRPTTNTMNMIPIIWPTNIATFEESECSDSSINLLFNYDI